MTPACSLLALLFSTAQAQLHVEHVAVVAPVSAGVGATPLAGSWLRADPPLGLPATLLPAPVTRALIAPTSSRRTSGLGSRAAALASHDWGAYFDQSRAQATGSSDAMDAPANAPIAALFGKLFAETPELEARIGARVAGAGLAAAYPDGAWKASVPRLFEPYFASRAGGQGLDEYLAGANADTPQAAGRRAGLARYILEITSHRAEDWTYIFRDHPLWKQPLEEYLDGLIRRRKVARRLDIDSVGAGYGSEAYSLAITVARALERAGEDPAVWDVRIRTQDVSLASLLAADKALYRPAERDRETFQELGLGRYFEPAEGELLRLRAPLRGWIQPHFADLNDESQHELLPAKTDVVFGNYLLFHLRRDPATALAERWLAGEWSDHGFLSMAQVLVAEVGASPRKRADVPLKYLYAGNVGWTGAAYYGENYRIPGGFKDVVREAFRRRGVVKAVQRRGAAIEGALSADPFARFELDGAALAALRGAAKAAGLEPRLTTDDISVRADAASGALYVNAGWLLASPDGAARLSAFERLIRSELARLPAGGPRGPPSGAITGRLMGGGVLKVGEAGGKPVLYWLTDRLTPITAAYRSDNAAKSDEMLEKDEAPQQRFHSNGIPKGVRGLY